MPIRAEAPKRSQRRRRASHQRRSRGRRSVPPSHRFGPYVWLEQVSCELVAGLHTELAKRLAEVVVDSAGADEQLGRDFLVRGTVGSEAGDLCFLGRKVVP